MTPEQSLRNYLAECTLHATVLSQQFKPRGND